MVLRYLKVIVNYGVFCKRVSSSMVGFIDSDYVDYKEDSKSTSGYVFMISGRAVAWPSRRQPIVTFSTTMVEFVAASECACQAIWMTRILKEIGHVHAAGTTLMYDNASTIMLSNNPVFHGRAKHIRIRFHFIRDLAREGVVYFLFSGTQDKLANLLTKPLKVEACQNMRKEFGMCTDSDLS